MRLNGVEKGYDEGAVRHRVLRGVDLEISQGEVVALVGASGSGKSTLLNLMSGIDLPDAGTVEVAGRSLGSLDETARTLFRRSHVGFVFQFFNLIPTLTVEENLRFPLELRGGPELGEEERLQGLLEAVGLGNRADSFPDRLSGGERQRVAVARALVHEPDLVLADEPTGNLDEATGAGVLDLMGQLVANEGRTLVLVTHAREVAARADRTFRLTGGALVPEE